MARPQAAGSGLHSAKISLQLVWSLLVWKWEDLSKAVVRSRRVSDGTGCLESHEDLGQAVSIPKAPMSREFLHTVR